LAISALPRKNLAQRAVQSAMENVQATFNFDIAGRDILQSAIASAGKISRVTIDRATGEVLSATPFVHITRAACRYQS